LANHLDWLKEQDVANTDQLYFTSKAALTIVVIIVHLALSALILAFILPLICNYLGSFNTKVEEILERTKRTSSSRRTRSRRRRMTEEQLLAEEERSTHILAIRVTDPELVANLCSVQESIAAHEPILRDCCVKPGFFHITIDTLRLEGPESSVAAIMESLRPVVREMFQDQESAKLEIVGLGNFEQRVVYAKVIHRLLCFLISIHIFSSG